MSDELGRFLEEYERYFKGESRTMPILGGGSVVGTSVVCETETGRITRLHLSDEAKAALSTDGARLAAPAGTGALGFAVFAFLCFALGFAVGWLL